MDTLVRRTDPEEDTDVPEEEFEPVFDPILFTEWDETEGRLARRQESKFYERNVHE